MSDWSKIHVYVTPPVIPEEPRDITLMSNVHLSEPIIFIELLQ